MFQYAFLWKIIMQLRAANDSLGKIYDPNI